MMAAPETCDVAIVGGGPAGLALATELRRLGVEKVVVLEREERAGGTPRHCGHYPFGFSEIRRMMKGPDYARTLVYHATQAGVDVRTTTHVTALHPNARLSLTTPDGPSDLHCKRVVLATGVREASRAQRFLGGARPNGVVTTGALQSMAYLQGLRPFRRPVILGTELVSFSAIMTCRHLGIRPVAMIEENNHITARRIFRPFAALKGVPIKYAARNLRICGHHMVENVSFFDALGQVQNISCDGVIVSGQFRPESALLHGSHLVIDPATGGPSVDQYGRTSDPRYFGAGNLLRPVETAAWCWREGVECARRVAMDMADPIGVTGDVPLRPADPKIRYVMPQRLALSDRPGAMSSMQIRLAAPVGGHLTAVSGGQTIWGDYLQSRPERRILAPLSPLTTVLKSGCTTPIDLKIFGDS